MTLELQLKIKNNPNYLRYLRDHSYWYKILNRDPSQFKKFEEEVRAMYKLRVEDRIEKVMNTMDMISAIMSTWK